MFLQFRGTSRLPFGRKAFQIPSRGKNAYVWLFVEKQLTTFDLAVEPRRESEFAEPGLYDGFGELASIADLLPAVNGASGRISVTAVPSDWLGATDTVLQFLG